MDTSIILRNVGQHISLDEKEKTDFLNLLSFKKVRYKQFLLEEGEVCHQSFFVNVGCLRAFSVDKNGVEHVLSFAPEGWWIADLYSLISKKPGNLYIEALKESEILILTKENQLRLYQENPKFERFFRILAENALVASQQRLNDNLSLSAEERYENFCKKYPSLINTLPQKQIASYIGVTPEFFSKMKNRMLRAR